MRKRCLEMVYELAKCDDRVIFLGSDLSPGLLQEMKKAMPDRYYMEGISEANIFGMAAGLALDGFIPFVNTIATFITRRGLEQIAIDTCLHNLPVRFIGNGGGFVYAPLGPTHQAIEDIATMRALPNMCVVCPCDANEMERFMSASLSWDGPIYIRLGKGGEKIVSSSTHEFTIGKAIELISCQTEKPFVSILSNGILAKRAIDAAKFLKNENVACKVIHHHTVKPIDEENIIKTVRESALIVTMEEHLLAGGFGSAVLEVIADKTPKPSAQIIRFGIPDQFARNYGSQDELLDFYGLNAKNVADNILKKMREC